MSYNLSFYTLAENHYRLDLSDGNQWYLGGYGDTVPWLDAFAGIAGFTKVSRQDVSANPLPMILFLEESLHKSGRFGNHPDGREPAYRKMWKRRNGASVSMWRHDECRQVICEIPIKDKNQFRYVTMWDALHPIYEMSLASGGLPFHTGLVERDGNAYLLSAPGDTGKSTCCRRIPPPWKALCDDEALVVLDSNDVYRTHPFPTWSDYIARNDTNKWDAQYSVPLGGLFFLEQSETDEVIELAQAETAALINNAAATVWRKYLFRSDDKEKREVSLKLFDNACRMAKRVPGFLLRVSLTGRFWEKNGTGHPFHLNRFPGCSYAMKPQFPTNPPDFIGTSKPGLLMATVDCSIC